KKKASYAAVDNHVDASTKIIGIGSGSSVIYCVNSLRELVESQKINTIAFIPTSVQAKQLILEANLPLAELNAHPVIDVAFDGADEIDTQLNLIKGGGGCHLMEKLVAVNAKVFVVVADYRKESEGLGLQWTQGIPIEVIPMAYVPIQKKIQSLGALSVNLRMAVRKAGPVVTDSGNLILDAHFGKLVNPAVLHKELIQIPGVVETGLFCGMADVAYLGCKDGSVKTLTGQAN
ncbi:hypothetical protein HDU76_007267, partial [Blyttiomyces sp. JEL0837]